MYKQTGGLFVELTISFSVMAPLSVEGEAGPGFGSLGVKIAIGSEGSSGFTSETKLVLIIK